MTAQHSNRSFGIGPAIFPILIHAGDSIDWRDESTLRPYLNGPDHEKEIILADDIVVWIHNGSLFLRIIYSSTANLHATVWRVFIRPTDDAGRGPGDLGRGWE